MLYNYFLCIGDSLTVGSRDSRGLGFPWYLQDMLKKEYGYPWVPIVRAKTGDTSVDLRRKIYDYVKGVPEAEIALLLIGTNDTKASNQGLHFNEEGETLFKRNLRHICDILTIYKKEIILGTLPPVGSFGGILTFNQYSDLCRKQFNKDILDLVAEFGANLVDFADMQSYLVDGCHMGSDGYIEMAERFFQAIKNW